MQIFIVGRAGQKNQGAEVNAAQYLRSYMHLLKQIKKTHYDFLVLGTGLAGLSFALKAQELGSVALISKTDLHSGNTERAQGGIAAVFNSEDSLESHYQDTLIAGAGLCDPKVVQHVVSQGPERIQDLVKWGVHFDINADKSFALTREGGHSQRRILHVEDHTGLDIHRQLLKTAMSCESIDFIEDHFAVDLITNRQINPRDFVNKKVVGAHLLNNKTQEVISLSAGNIILATGGAGKTYLYTSNWEGATGDGIAMAYRAGARVANLEFTQFHPTCLYHPHARNFLISEALRGEGGELKNAQGIAFMEKYHKLKSLAPRDIVARSIDAEMRLSGADCVYLDMTHKSSDYLQTRFPLIYNKCSEYSIDIAKDPIPVVPAAHYQCGGVLTDLNGQTDIENLFAIGEVACTGLHGANRLASNSLLECLVFADSVFNFIKSKKVEKIEYDLPVWKNSTDQNSDEMMLVSHMWDEVRRLMWAYVGIVRSDKRLRRAQNRMQNIINEFNQYYSTMKARPEIFELRNIAIVADLTVKCAIQRKESVGIHFNLDRPHLIDSERRLLADTVLAPRAYDF